VVSTGTLNSENKNNAVKIGAALIDNDCYIKMADESVYRFWGDFANFPITQNIHPDYKASFKEKINSLSIEKKDYMILKLRNTSNISRSEGLDESSAFPKDQYITAVIFMKKDFAAAKNTYFTNLEIYDIMYLYNCEKKLSFIKSKYASFLGLSDDLYFEYKEEDKIMTFFQFKNGQKEIKFKKTLESIQKKAREMVSEDDMSNFNKMIFDIENFSNNFFYIIKSNILSNLFRKTDDIEKVSVKGTTINKGSEKKSVIGIIKNSALMSASDINFLENRANIDSLTGLLNKKAIAEEINTELKSDELKTLSLVMMDIDYFKDINDTYGHMFGDEVLTAVANVLKTVIGERGIIGRIGGDEFLIAIKNLNNRSELRSILKSIRSKIEWAYSGQIKISTSLGTATYPKDADNYETLLKISDKCLYIAKEKGRNRFIIYDKNIHGPLSASNVSSKAISINQKVNITQKSEHICDIIEKLSKIAITKKTGNSFSKENIIEVADTLKTYYMFDKCLIFYNNRETPLYSLNANAEDLEIISILDDYKNIFDDRNMLIVGNYISVEAKNTKLYKFLSTTKNYSTVQYLIKDLNAEIKGLIFISTYNHSNKWSEVDINYLAVIFKLISKALIGTNPGGE